MTRRIGSLNCEPLNWPESSDGKLRTVERGFLVRGDCARASGQTNRQINAQSSAVFILGVLLSGTEVALALKRIQLGRLNVMLAVNRCPLALFRCLVQSSSFSLGFYSE